MLFTTLLTTGRYAYSLASPRYPPGTRVPFPLEVMPLPGVPGTTTDGPTQFTLYPRRDLSFSYPRTQNA
eukprot:2374703-Rhodomonas_salina.1